MSTCYTSTVILDGLTLDLDPTTYKVLGGKRRGAAFPQVGGSTIFQDRGFDGTDIKVSMNGQLTSAATVDTLMATYRKVGYIFTFSDFKGNIFQCIFEPGEESFVLEPLRGSNIGWTYTILLRVVTVTQWLGSSFPATS